MANKVLIAILSCHAHRHYAEAQRSTWIPDIPTGVDYKFFLGRPATELKQDEETLDVEDTFQGVTEKTAAMYGWALEHGYDFMFKADLDTLVRPRELLSSGFEQHDYVGGCNSLGSILFASGGAGYWLSKRAMQAVVAAPVAPGPAEDVHTARALLECGIGLDADSRYKFCPGDVMDDYTLTYHLSSIRGWDVKYTPNMMYQAYSDQKNRVYRSYVEKPEIRFNRRLRRP